MTIIGGPNWCLWLVTTFEHVMFFATSSSILVFQPILFHTIVTEGHYMLYSIEKGFFLNVEKNCWLWCDKWHAKGHTYFGVHHVQWCFCFASSVCFGSIENLSLSGFAGDWCHFPSRRQPYTSICSSNFFLDRCLCLSPSLLTLFVIWHSFTTWFKYRFSRIKSADYFVFCVYMPLWFTLGIVSSVEGIWLDVPLMRLLVISHNFFAT